MPRYDRHPETGCRVSSFVSTEVVWLMDGEQLESIVEEIRVKLQLNPELLRTPVDDEPEVDDKKPGYTVDEDGVATIGMSGPFTKYGTSFSDNSTIRHQKSIREAVRDPKVKGLALNIDSPGGTFTGMSELVEEIKQADAVKPVVAYGEGMLTSGAYYAASPARRIFASRGTMVGSIGTGSVLKDTSGTYDANKVKVLKFTGHGAKYKLVGQPGLPVTDEQKVDLQRRVDEVNEIFTGDVARYRGADVKQIRDLEARVFVGEKALEHKLVDQIGTWQQAKEYLKTQFKAEGTPVDHRYKPQEVPAPAANGGPAPAQPQPVAIERSADAMNAQQIQTVRTKFPGAANVPDAQLEDWLIAQLGEHSSLVTQLKANQAPTMSDETIHDRTQVFHSKLSELQSGGFLTKAQVESYKQLAQKGSPLCVSMLQRDGDGYAFEKILAPHRDATAKVVAGQQTGKPVAEERQTPGAADAKVADGAKNAEVTMQQAGDKAAGAVLDRYKKAEMKRDKEAATRNN